MNVFGWVLLGAAGLAAVADWAALRRGHRLTEQLAKPAFILLLLAMAWLVHADATWPGRLLLLGLVLSLVGDIVLLDRRPADDRFLLGLATFLVAHLAYLGAVFALPGMPPSWVGLGVTVVAAGGALWWVRRAAEVTSSAAGAVTAYGLVLALVTAVAWWRGHLLVGLGLTLFGVSGVLLGRLRFSRTPVGRGSEVAVMATYHAAQVLVVLGVLRPDLVG